MTARAWNPRYVAWAASNGRDPQAQLDHDCQQRGKMVDFMLWNRARWREWEKLTGWRGTGKSLADHAAYDAWLSAKYPAVQSAAEQEMSTPTLFDLLAAGEAEAA